MSKLELELPMGSYSTRKTEVAALYTQTGCSGKPPSNIIRIAAGAGDPDNDRNTKKDQLAYADPYDLIDQIDKILNSHIPTYTAS